MAEQSKFVVVSGRKPVVGVREADAVGGILASVQAMGGVREATTGRVVTVPRLWAVSAAPKATPETMVALPRVQASERTPVREEELAFYRKYTERLLQRYLQMTMEAGRVPSLMGREVIGGKASSYRIHGFDDAVNFRLDVEKCLRFLSGEEREVIRRVAIQEYTQGEAAELMGVSLRTVVTRYGRALDRLTGILLRARLLDPVRACQVAASARRR